MDEPRCADCRFAMIEEHAIYCAHPDVFNTTGFGQDVDKMRAPTGLCAGARLFRGRDGDARAERRSGEDRRIAERRHVIDAPTNWWRKLLRTLSQ